MIRQVPLLGYPSQLSAITALMGEGLGKRQIMDRTGLASDRVSSLMAHAKRAAAARAAGPEWTVERVERAMRIYAAGMAVMAEAFGVSVAEFADVVTHRIRNQDSTEDGDGKDDAQRPDGGDGVEPGGVQPGSGSDDAGGPPSIASDSAAVAVAEAAEGGADAVAVRAEGGASAASQPDRSAEPSSEPAAEPPVAERFVNGQGFVAAAEPTDVEVEREAMAAEFPAAMRFSLRSADGQSLHQHARGLTRLASFFWLGTAEQVARLKRQHPQWAQLQPKAWK